MKTALLVASTIAALATAWAETATNPDPMPGASKDECVFVRNISNWRVLDTRNVVLYAPNERRAYLMQLGAPISDLESSFKVAFIDRDSNGQLCGRGFDKVQGVGSPVRQPATPITGLTRLDEAGLQVLEAQYNVTLTRKKDRGAPQQP